jgi:hypothetical protein
VVVAVFVVLIGIEVSQASSAAGSAKWQAPRFCFRKTTQAGILDGLFIHGFGLFRWPAAISSCASRVDALEHNFTRGWRSRAVSLATRNRSRERLKRESC